MKLLFDHNLSYKLVGRLADLFPDSEHVRNVVPAETGVWIRAMQAKAWEAGKNDSLWIDPIV